MATAAKVGLDEFVKLETCGCDSLTRNLSSYATQVVQVYPSFCLSSRASCGFFISGSQGSSSDFVTSQSVD